MYFLGDLLTERGRLFFSVHLGGSFDLLGPVDLRWINEEVCPTCRKA